MKPWIIGVDIGGTKVAVSLGTQRGKILGKMVFSSGKTKKAKVLLRQIESSISELLKKHHLSERQLLGIGVAVPGAIDPRREVVLKSPNSRYWEHFPVKTILVRRFHVPTFIENDANAAALGEQYFGAGRNLSDFLYITVSTGIGSGIVANGTLIRGTKGTAGEIGHMTLVPNGLLCGCGKRGCLEAYSSGTAIADYVKRELKNGARSRFFKKVKLSEITGQLVSETARNIHDPLAIQAKHQAADFLGMGLANVINLLNPERIFLGGGVMEHIDHFWSPMMEAVKREAWPMALKACKIVRSKLGGRIGDFGAMAVVLEHRQQNN
ncbi:MAG: ROK family protein [Candidatus Omnitrophica bacterium]|nr:ROK family protein [Candidatus Omnitrophota bacterium]